MAWKTTESNYTQGERWFILYDYLRRNSRKGHPVSRKQIFDYLSANYDITISPHTFYADMEILSNDAFGLHIELDRSAFHGKGGYYITNPLFEPHELRMLVDSVQSSQFIPQKTADAISRKIRQMAGEADRDTLNRPAAVSRRVRSMNESVVKESGRIYEAIATNSKIAFRYFHRSPNRNNPTKYVKDGSRVIVSPFAMLWDSGRYYLYAYDGKRFRTYRIDRMEGIACLVQEREGVAEYKATNLNRQKATVFDMFHGKEYNISFRCHNQIADAVIDKFGDRVMLIPDGDSHFTFTAPIEVSPPFYAWVATFGRYIRITSPAGVINGMKEFLQKATDMYKDKAEM